MQIASLDVPLPSPVAAVHGRLALIAGASRSRRRSQQRVMMWAGPSARRSAFASPAAGRLMPGQGVDVAAAAAAALMSPSPAARRRSRVVGVRSTLLRPVTGVNAS